MTKTESDNEELARCDQREDSGPFDIIGDVHGCAGELEMLLVKLGYAVSWRGEPSQPSVLVSAPHGRRVVFVGDLVDRGDADSYRRLVNALSVCPFPVWPSIGNHDDRANFMHHFPAVPTAGGFVQYEADLGPLRLIVLDTLEEGRHGGAFCETRAQWLSERLAEQADRPTIIVMHHPPFAVGIDWMNTHPEEPWVERVSRATAGKPQIKAILCGHLHRPIVAPWNGTTVAICASTAPQVALDLRPIDPDTPDNRPMIVADPPAFALHWWNGRELVTHFETADDHVMLAKYDADMQPVVQGLLSERPA